MARFFKNRTKNKGLAPGSLVFIGNEKIDNIRIRIIDFNNEKLEELELQNIKSGKRFDESGSVSWINIDGLHDVESIRKIGTIFNLHSLLLEDVLNTDQRPKYEEFDDHLFLVTKMLYFDEEREIIRSEQLSMIIGDNYLITFQEKVGDVFEPVRERIRKQKGRIRASGVDYLAYALLDTIVDNYIYLIQRFGEKIEDLDIEIFENASSQTLEKISGYKKEMSFIRKSIFPARELISHLARSDSELIREETEPFLKDLLDLITQANEITDTYREMLSDQLNMYNSSISNKMNDIMKVLTIFAAIFIPLTFIAGIYGTNFDYLPELKFKYSYYIFWGILISIGGGMLLFFKKKGWF